MLPFSEENDVKRIWLIASLQLILVVAFGALIGTFAVTGCGDSGDGETTPDVAARLETEARDAARDAEQAMKAAAREGSEAADELVEPGEQAREAAQAEAGDATADVAAGAQDALDGVREGLPSAASAGDPDCLELVDEGAWAEAVSVCTQALSSDAENPALRRALDEARREATAAEAEAAGEIDDALGGMR